MNRIAEIEARIAEMNEHYSGCDWCCGGGDIEMLALQNELAQLQPYEVVTVDENGNATQIPNLSLEAVNVHIRNLKPNCSLSIYKTMDFTIEPMWVKHVGGAFVNHLGRKTVSFLKQ